MWLVGAACEGEGLGVAGWEWVQGGGARCGFVWLGGASWLRCLLSVARV